MIKKREIRHTRTWSRKLEWSFGSFFHFRWVWPPLDFLNTKWCLEWRFKVCSWCENFVHEYESIAWLWNWWILTLHLELWLFMYKLMRILLDSSWFEPTSLLQILSLSRCWFSWYLLASISMNKVELRTSNLNVSHSSKIQKVQLSLDLIWEKSVRNMKLNSFPC